MINYVTSTRRPQSAILQLIPKLKAAVNQVQKYYENHKFPKDFNCCELIMHCFGFTDYADWSTFVDMCQKLSSWLSDSDYSALESVLSDNNKPAIDVFKAVFVDDISKYQTLYYSVRKSAGYTYEEPLKSGDLVSRKCAKGISYWSLTKTIKRSDFQKALLSAPVVPVKNILYANVGTLTMKDYNSLDDVMETLLSISSKLSGFSSPVNRGIKNAFFQLSEFSSVVQAKAKFQHEREVIVYGIKSFKCSVVRSQTGA